MIVLHGADTQNARKVTMMLEECGLRYEPRPVDLQAEEQRTPAFLALNPNGRIPVLVDEPESGARTVVGESGAILVYLAEKTGLFLPASGQARYATMQWTFWQMSAIGPTFGNVAHFASVTAPPEQVESPFLRATMAQTVNHDAIARFTAEGFRLLQVLEALLGRSDWMAGEISIADFATFAWIDSAWSRLSGGAPGFEERVPGITAWRRRLLDRPAVQRGLVAFKAGTAEEART